MSTAYTKIKSRGRVYYIRHQFVDIFNSTYHESERIDYADYVVEGGKFVKHSRTETFEKIMDHYLGINNK